MHGITETWRGCGVVYSMGYAQGERREELFLWELSALGFTHMR